MTKSENQKLAQQRRDVASLSRRVDALRKSSTESERAELLESCPDMPAATKRVLATASIDVARQLAKDHLASATQSRAASRAEMARKMGRPAPAPTTASTWNGRSQSFANLTPEQARAMTKSR